MINNFYIPTTELPEKQWRISLVLAIALHFLVFGIALFGPLIFNFRRPLPEVYTVNLFTVEEASAPAMAPQPKAEKVTEAKPQKEVPPPPAPAKKPAPVEKAVEKPVETAAPSAKAISLKPMKEKSKTDQDQVKKLREKLLIQEKAKKAEAEAEKTARDALEKLKDSLYTQNQVAKTKVEASGTADATPSGPQGGPAGGVTVDENTRRYLLAVTNQIQEHWKVPLYQNWDPNLEVRAIITVRKDGTVLKTDMEHKSDNIYFNQLVEKTIKDSSPLPPFSLGMDDEQMDIGLRFTLQGLF